MAAVPSGGRLVGGPDPFRVGDVDGGGASCDRCGGTAGEAAQAARRSPSCTTWRGCVPSSSTPRSLGTMISKDWRATTSPLPGAPRRRLAAPGPRDTDPGEGRGHTGLFGGGRPSGTTPAIAGSPSRTRPHPPRQRTNVWRIRLDAVASTCCGSRRRSVEGRRRLSGDVLRSCSRGSPMTPPAGSTWSGCVGRTVSCARCASARGLADRVGGVDVPRLWPQDVGHRGHDLRPDPLTAVGVVRGGVVRVLPEERGLGARAAAGARAGLL